MLVNVSLLFGCLEKQDLSPTCDVVTTNDTIKLINHQGRVTMTGDCCKVAQISRSGELTF